MRGHKTQATRTKRKTNEVAMRAKVYANRK